jgi:hypothetical protein
VAVIAAALYLAGLGPAPFLDPPERVHLLREAGGRRRYSNLAD